MKETSETLEVFETKKQIAARFHKTTRTVEYWTQLGILPVIKINRSVFYHWPTIVRMMLARQTFIKKGDHERTQPT